MQGLTDIVVGLKGRKCTLEGNKKVSTVEIMKVSDQVQKDDTDFQVPTIKRGKEKEKRS